MIYGAVNQDGLVFATLETTGTPPSGYIQIDSHAKAGWHYDAETQTFTPPPAPAELRHISVGAFFDRFGVQKWAILADTNPAVQALVKDCSVRKYIDLDREDLPAALALIVASGREIDPETIIDAPVQAKELP